MATPKKVVHRARTARHRAGGKDVVPDDALHPLARPRPAPAAAKWDWVGTKGRVRAQGPCWRPSCPSPNSCNAGAGCPVHLRLQEQHGRDTEQYLRAMLAEGPFHPFSKHASLNEVSARFGRDVPADYPLPVAPGPRAESQAHLPPARMPLPVQGHGPRVQGRP